MFSVTFSFIIISSLIVRAERVVRSARSFWRAIVFKLASLTLEHPRAYHLKASTIAISLEISTKTVYRATSRLESLGIVKKETTVKSKGGQGASNYIILPYNVRA